MPFGIEFDAERCKQEIQDTMETFGKTYAKKFGIALVKKVMNDALGAKEAEAEEKKRQLMQCPPEAAPDKSGEMKMQSSILKRWKPKFFWIKDNYDLAYNSTPGKKEKEEGVINLWGYKVQGTQFKPEGPRKGGPEWVPDEERPNCILCNKEFTKIIWHHHCRNCGEVFCSDCAGNKMMMTHFGYEKPQRVCNTCFEKEAQRGRSSTVAVQQEEAKEDATFHGLQLLHSTRTPYVLQCENLAEKKEWMDVLSKCCSKAEAPVNPNPVQAYAFEFAHKEARWRAGIYWWWYITGSEEEMISDLIARNVERTVVDPAIASAPADLSPKLKRMATTAINKQVQTLIRTVVGPAWKAVTDALNDSQDKIEEKIKPIIDPIQQARQKAMDTIKQKVMELISPILEKFGKMVLDLLLPVVGEPIIQAYGKMFGIMDNVMSSVAKRSEDRKAFAEQIKYNQRDCSGRNGPMWDVHRLLEDLSWELRKKKSENDFLSSFQVTDTINAILASIHGLVNNAFYTLENHESLTENASEGAVLKAWKTDVRDKLVADAQNELIDIIKLVLNQAVMAPVQEKVLANEALQGILGPIDETIPEVVAEFISVSGLFEELLGSVCDESVSIAVDAGSEKSKQELFGYSIGR